MTKSFLNYTPFAQKYRPTNFSELMGQDVLVKTLSYCIQNNRLSHAYLLTGIRGVGKTSSARIIAKTVNCTDLQIVSLQIFPCNNCKNCKSFNEHSHPDIIEIDAASYTSVDDIRKIIQSSEYRPLLGGYKFFIIDEIHMLSKSAFNALLKIVEEPPAHIIFIFATTEVHKIPLTVISRCQRYDLRRLTFDETYSLIKQISEKEIVKFEEEALKIIASKSEGSARDAVSILDQAASYIHKDNEKNSITTEIVNKMLGLLRMGTIIEFIQLIIANDPKKAIKLLNEIYENSSNLEYFIQAMSDFIAHLCKAKVISNYHTVIYQEYFKEISQILIGMSLSRLSTLWQIFNHGIYEIKQSHNELITAEMLLIKAIYSCNLPCIEEISDSLEESSDISIKSDNIHSRNEKKSINNETISNINDIFSYLRYCHKEKEMDIYYLLLNEVEVVEFCNEKMIVNGNVSSNVISKIENLLNKWSNSNWKVSSVKNKVITTLKSRMLDKVTQAEDYRIIKKYFPDSNISDIILKS